MDKYCSFCGTDEYKTLVSGPKVYICEECIFKAIEILKERGISIPSELLSLVNH